MNILKTKPQKMSLDAIKNTMSKAEMKGIIAGSGSDYYNNSGMTPEQQQYLYSVSTSGMGGGAALAAAAYNTATYGPPTNNSSTTTSSNSSNNTWGTNANGNYATSNAADIARFMEMMKDPNTVSSHSIADIRSFINGEMSIMTQITQLTQTAQLTGSVGQVGIYDVAAIKALQAKEYTQLREVLITANYKKVVSGSNAEFGNYDIFTNPFTNDTIQLYTGSGGSTIFTGSGVVPITSHGSVTKPTPLEAAFMSKAVYGDYVDPKNLTGWSVSHAADGLGIIFNSVSGLKSQLFEKTLPNGTKEYCYVTAGTESRDPGDYAANVLQLVGASQEYTESIKNAKALAALFGGALSFAGHSLGGGLAEANAIATGDSALTFNAAGLSFFTTGFSTSSNTDAYVVQNDPLNLLQQISNYLPSAGGTVHYLANGGSIIDAHSINTAITGLGGKP